MCGILGLLLHDINSDACPEIFESLNLLQHRGQDAAGILTCGTKGRFYQYKGSGLVSNIFKDHKLKTIRGSMGIGHLRYPTAGEASAQSEAQPFYVNSPYGLGLAHNGNLINAPELREYLDSTAHRHINTDSDSEVLLNCFASSLQETGKRRVNADDIFAALKSGVYEKCIGGYTCVGMVAGYGVFAIRDPHGIRPLVIGERRSVTSSTGTDYLLASESVVMDSLGFSNVRDLKPGEAVIIPRGSSTPIFKQLVPQKGYAPDLFEYVYFARPDSVMDGISVYRARQRMGDYLAKTVERVIKQRYNTLPSDMIQAVIPVPDTARTAALQVAMALNIRYAEGFVKNRYVGRTFIMPGQQARRANVRRKLNAMTMEFKDKCVLIVDDSIVRGTTSKEIVQMARDAGARKVLVASSAPPIRHAHIYGIDLADVEELVGHNRSTDQINDYIGADEIIYQELPDLVRACQDENPNIDNFESGVFTGCYVTGVATEYLQHLHDIRVAQAERKKIANGHSTTIKVNGVHDEDQKADDDINLYNHNGYGES